MCLLLSQILTYTNHLHPFTKLCSHPCELEVSVAVARAFSDGITKSIGRLCSSNGKFLGSSSGCQPTGILPG